MAFIPRTENCSFCQQPYLRTASRHLFCCEDCKERAKNGGERRLCAFCDTPLTTKQPKYCSTQCKYDHTKVLHQKTCKHCQILYTPSHKRQQYCSVICKDRGLANIKQFTCQYCGIVFERKNCKNKEYKYCSSSCSARATNARRTPSVGTRLRRSDGYYTIQTPEGSMFEHRYVMEQKLGRKLYPGENVHHIDGDRGNNDPENLELWQVSQPAGVRL